eukprot:TRINITY_DN29574_c0_g1_i1.p1 TRINITY_DN29574_c0_g1~~TRINITY_DN29574_c0_g1_i1.p1  ORF type:complete len:467 (-),score=107.04 TRINITY_DN29574_c0_g1_i1:99-1499(-)
MGLPKVGDESFYDPDFPTGLAKMAANVPEELGMGYYTEYGVEKLLVTRPEFATTVLQDNVEHYLWAGISYASQCFFGEKVLFVVEGEEWQALRKLLRPNLMKGNLPELCQDVASAASALVERLGAMADAGRTVDMLHAAQAYHLDATGQALYGSKFGTVGVFPEPHPIVEAFNFFLDELPRRSFDPDPAVHVDYSTDNEANRAMWTARDQVHGVVRSAVGQRLSQRRQGVVREDTLEMFIRSYEQEFGRANLTETGLMDKLGANLVELIFAGYNTYVMALGSAVWALAENRDLLAKLREEARRVLNGRAVEFKDYGELKLHYMTFQETLRLYGPTPAIARKVAPSAMPLGEHLIPVGAEVMIPFVHVHQDPLFWDSPSSFDPELHFSSPPKRGTFLPFSDGPRSCLGQHYAGMAFCVALAALVQNFDFTVAPGYEFGLNFNGFGFGPCNAATGKKQVLVNLTRRKM